MSGSYINIADVCNVKNNIVATAVSTLSASISLTTTTITTTTTTTPVGV